MLSTIDIVASFFVLNPTLPCACAYLHEHDRTAMFGVVLRCSATPENRLRELPAWNVEKHVLHQAAFPKNRSNMQAMALRSCGIWSFRVQDASTQPNPQIAAYAGSSTQLAKLEAPTTVTKPHG